VTRSPPKDLEARWERNKKLRKKAVSNELSPEELQSLPSQLRLPVKLRGFARPKTLRGPALVKWLRIQGGVWQDKRFDDFINALFEHGIVDPHTYEFTDRQGPGIDQSNEYQQARCLAEVRARIRPGTSTLRACQEVAAEWALGNSLEAGAKQLSDQLRKK
jgi:hypothetical protein